MASFTIGSGVTDTTAKTVTNNDTGTIQAGGTLSVATAITWTGGSASPGVVIDNSGTINATTRGIDTSGSFSTGSITFDNEVGAKLIASGNDGFRVNTNITNGTITINNSGLLVSGAVDASGHVIAHSSGQAIDLGAVTSSTAVVNITNAAGATIGSSGDDAIRPGSGHITITNDGLIDATASANRAINLNDGTTANLSEFHLINNADGTIQSQGDAVRITASTLSTTATYNVTVDNAGVIQSTGVGGSNGQAIDFNDLNSPLGTVTITNEATGVIHAADADAIRGAANAVINNYGEITSSNGTPTSTGNDGIDFQANAGGTVNNFASGLIEGARHGITGDNPVTVTNYGTIKGDSGSGVNLDTAPTTTTSVTNYGTIIGTSVNGDGDGIDVDGLVTIENHGTIQATGVLIAGEVQEGLAIGGGTVDNYAGASIVSFERAITVDDSNFGNAFGPTTIYNEGLIQGGTYGAISITDTFADTITNKGQIVGSVSTGGGDDTVNLYTGSTISGLIDGGDGNDTINLLGNGSDTLSNVANIENLAVQAGDWSVLDNESYSNGVTIAAGATLQLGNGSSAGDIGGNVVDNGTLVFDRSDVDTFAGTVSGSGSVEQIGTGTLVLDGHSSYAGGTEIVSGTLDVLTVDGAGTGAITFGTGAETLQIDQTALTGGHFANTVDGFLTGDSIDLSSIGTATGVSLGAGNVLTIAGGTTGPVTLQLDASQNFDGLHFHLASDGDGGTLVTIAPDQAPVANADINGVSFRDGPLVTLVDLLLGHKNDPSTLQVDAAHGVLANDTDADNDMLNVTGVSFDGTSKGIAANGSTAIQGEFGTLTLNSDGSYTYAAGKGINFPGNGLAQDQFTYTESDGHGGTSQSTLTISLLNNNQQYIA